MSGRAPTRCRTGRGKTATGHEPQSRTARRGGGLAAESVESISFSCAAFRTDRIPNATVLGPIFAREFLTVPRTEKHYRARVPALRRSVDAGRHRVAGDQWARPGNDAGRNGPVRPAALSDLRHS